MTILKKIICATFALLFLAACGAVAAEPAPSPEPVAYTTTQTEETTTQTEEATAESEASTTQPEQPADTPQEPQIPPPSSVEPEQQALPLGAAIDRSAWPDEISFATQQQIYPANTESVTAILSNNAANDLLMLDGTGFFLEKQVNGQWQRVPATIWAQDYAISIGAGGHRQFIVYNAQFHTGEGPAIALLANRLLVDSFTSGTWRIVINAALWRQNDRFTDGRVQIWQGPVYAEFVIEA